jgi:four helix bundle protein
VESGKWKVESGKRKAESGKWKVESGKRKVESGKWKVESGRVFKLDKLLVWKKAHILVLDIYKVTKNFPSDELYGLTSQMRRAVTSVPCNIAEGKARGSTKDFKRFLLIARGSLEELKYQVILSKDLDYINEDKYDELQNKAKEVGRLLAGLIKSLN